MEPEKIMYMKYPDKKDLYIDGEVGRIGQKVKRLLPNSFYVGMGAGRSIIEESSNNNLFTNGIANCKGIVLVFQNNETLDLVYTLEHSPPDGTPDFEIPTGFTLIEKKWIDGPAGSLRNYLKDSENRARFNALSCKEGNQSLKISRRNDTGSYSPNSVSIRLIPCMNSVIILDEY